MISVYSDFNKIIFLELKSDSWNFWFVITKSVWAKTLIKNVLIDQNFRISEQKTMKRILHRQFDCEIVNLKWTLVQVEGIS